MLDNHKLRSQISAELKPFTDISRSLQQLLSTKHFDMLTHVLTAIYETESSLDKHRSTVLKEHLKVIVPCMINEIWGGNKEKVANWKPSNTQRSSSRKSPSPERTSTSIGRLTTERNSNSPSRLLMTGNGSHSRRSSPLRLSGDASEPTLSRSLSGLNYQEAHSLSDFCHINGHQTFSKSKRPLTKGHQRSPGPAAYKADRLSLHPSSPKLTIPKGGKKGELFSPPYSPGPAAYYVMRHYVAKHS